MADQKEEKVFSAEAKSFVTEHPWTFSIALFVMSISLILSAICLILYSFGQLLKIK